MGLLNCCCFFFVTTPCTVRETSKATYIYIILIYVFKLIKSHLFYTLLVSLFNIAVNSQGKLFRYARHRDCADKESHTCEIH